MKRAVRNSAGKRRRGYSTLRAQLRQEERAEMAKLTPAERLRIGLEFSDFCMTLAAKAREANAQRSAPESR